MRRVAYRSLPWSRFALVAAIVVSITSCSTDADRFRDSPRSGGRPSADLTGTTAPNAAPAINTATLPPPQASQPSPLGSPLPPPAAQISSAPAAPAAPAKQVVATPPAPGGLQKHRVVAGDTLRKIARQYGVPVSELAAANKVLPNAKLKAGEQIVIPARSVQIADASPASQKAAANAKPAPAPLSNARKITPTPEVSAENRSKAATLSFRWPVRGRIISGFGPKPGGQANAGINIAVPEGTAVKAAEDGVVVYANNELKTYGNLLLIRHGNDYVTAYAHLSEILVKHGDTVKRGQVVAKSGQTGEIASPQLHFEIRKKSTAVDPMPYLDRAAAL